MVRDESKLPDDSGEVPKPNGVVGGLIPNHKIVPLLDRKLAKWSKKHLLYSYNIKMKNKRRKRSWSANFGPNDKFWKRGRGADKSFCFNKFAVIEGYTNSIK